MSFDSEGGQTVILGELCFTKHGRSFAVTNRPENVSVIEVDGTTRQLATHHELNAVLHMAKELAAVERVHVFVNRADWRARLRAILRGRSAHTRPGQV